MRSVDRAFYKSIEWRRCREGFLKANPLCAECLKQGRYTPAKHVHHIEHLNARNVTDPSVALNWDNLEGVCQECHNKLHSGRSGRRYHIDKDGRLVIE